MNTLTHTFPLIRTAFSYIQLHSTRTFIRNFGSNNSVPKEVTVNLEVRELFKHHKLNQEYLEDKIKEALRSVIPKNVKYVRISKVDLESRNPAPNTSSKLDDALFNYLLIKKIEEIVTNSVSNLSQESSGKSSDRIYSRHSYSSEPLLDRSSPDQFESHHRSCTSSYSSSSNSCSKTSNSSSCDYSSYSSSNSDDVNDD